MPQSKAERLLQVQTVLFETDLGQVWRLLRGVDAAARHVLDAGVVGSVAWALGDSSSAPVVRDRDVSELLGATHSLADVTYEFFGRNLGSSGGANRLATRHSGDLLMILNPDTYPSPTALTELVRVSDTPGVGIVEARQIPLEHPKAYALRGGDTSWASGCCMLIRRSVFDELGGFDEVNFLLHCDDVDFSWRAKAAGYRVVFAPFASVFHDKRPRLDSAWPAPDVELYHAVLGRLMLASRWNRPDIVQETITAIDTSGSSVQREAVGEFRARERAGRIPASVDDASVAEFVNGEYAVHRF
jgi:hypothetical protein